MKIYNRLKQFLLLENKIQETEQLYKTLKFEFEQQKQNQKLMKAQLANLQNMSRNIEQIRLMLEHDRQYPQPRRGKSETLEILLKKLEERHD